MFPTRLPFRSFNRSRQTISNHLRTTRTQRTIDLPELHLDALAAPTPRVLWIELTSKCPFDCVFCTRSLLRGAGEHLDFDLYRRLISELEAPEIIRLNYSGESIHYPHLVEAIELAASTGAATELVSAFGSISSRTLERLVPSGLDRLTVSLHTLAEDEYTRIYRHGSLATAKRRIAQLIQLRDRAGRSAPSLDFGFVAMARNLEQLPRLAEYARSCGVSLIHVVPVIRRDPIPEKFDEELSGNILTEPFKTDLEEMLARVRADFPDITIQVRNLERAHEGRIGHVPDYYSGPVPEWARIKTCDQNPWETVHVLSNGDVVTCEVREKSPLGNLHHESIADIWRGDAYRLFRERYVRGHDDHCRDCCWKKVHRPAPLVSYIDAGSPQIAQLLRGWHDPDGSGVAWSKREATAVLRFTGSEGALRVQGILPPSLTGNGNSLEVSSRGQRLGVVENLSSEMSPLDVIFELPPQLLDSEELVLSIALKEVYRPILTGKSGDIRDLGFALQRVELLNG